VAAARSCARRILASFPGWAQLTGAAGAYDKASRPTSGHMSGDATFTLSRGISFTLRSFT